MNTIPASAEHSPVVSKNVATATGASTGAATQVAADLQSATLFSTTVSLPHGDMLAVADESNLLLLAYKKRHRFEDQLARLQKRLGVEELVAWNPNSDESAPLGQIGLELEAYFAGDLERFATPFQLLGTEFQVAVWQKLCEIPYGQTWSYAQLAASLGRPTASRAVARANATNRLSIIVPCHRVIASDGSIAGYAGGVDRKQRLLELEGSRECRQPLFD